MFLYHLKYFFNLLKNPGSSGTIALRSFQEDNTTDFHYYIHKSLKIPVLIPFSQSNERFHICILESGASIESEALQKAR